MILLIDNYDSFTYNLYQLMRRLGQAVEVRRNDAVTMEEIESGRWNMIVLSPGPGTPSEAGVSCLVVERFAGRLPILGICLGHQVIGQVFGGQVVRAPEPCHGKVGLIRHDGDALFQGVTNTFPAGRYHSLVVAANGLPPCLAVTAYNEEGLIMGLRHKEYPVFGLQFHPESILTPDGAVLLENFFRLAAA